MKNYLFPRNSKKKEQKKNNRQSLTMYHPSRIWKANDNSDYISKGISSHNRYTLGDQGIVKATVSGVFEDLDFKIS